MLHPNRCACTVLDRRGNNILTSALVLWAALDRVPTFVAVPGHPPPARYRSTASPPSPVLSAMPRRFLEPLLARLTGPLVQTQR